MTGLRAARPTPIESGLAAVLLVLSLAEALFSDEQPAVTAVRLLSAVLPPVAVAFSRSRPEQAACVAVFALVFSSLQQSPSGTLGAGFAWLALAFGLAAWTRQPWPWLLALVLAGTLRDLRTVGFDETDVVIDWAFAGFTIWMGRLVHRRSVLADALTTRLHLADIESEARTEEAVARQRAVIARELHDIVAHSVSLMVVQAGTARPIAQRTDRELADVLETIESIGREALTELRRLLVVLRAEDENELPPVPDLNRLDDLVDGVRRAGVDVRATFALPTDVPPGVALCAYRAVQEGLTNAIRHADGSRVDVDVAADDRILRVRVQDGGGAVPSHGIGAGAGLVGLRERVLLCGGLLTAGPHGSGYLLEVKMPISDRSPAADSVPIDGEVQ